MGSGNLSKLMVCILFVLVGFRLAVVLIVASEFYSVTDMFVKIS